MTIQPNLATRRFPDCIQYGECLDRAAAGNQVFSCDGCQTYRRSAYHPTIQDLAGCLALYLALFHTDVYQQLTNRPEFKIWLLRSFLAAMTVRA